MAIKHMLGAFKGSPTKALELEAALPPPDIRFEKLCNMYALRTLKFQPNHPIVKTLIDLTEDKLGEQYGEAVNIAHISTPHTQLLALFQRVKKLIRGDWKVNKPYAD